MKIDEIINMIKTNELKESGFGYDGIEAYNADDVNDLKDKIIKQLQQLKQQEEKQGCQTCKYSKPTCFYNKIKNNEVIILTDSCYKWEDK